MTGFWCMTLLTYEVSTHKIWLVLGLGYIENMAQTNKNHMRSQKSILRSQCSNFSGLHTIGLSHEMCSNKMWLDLGLMVQEMCPGQAETSCVVKDGEIVRTSPSRRPDRTMDERTGSKPTRVILKFLVGDWTSLTSNQRDIWKYFCR